MKILIHIGSHKTGSSSLQRFFVANRKALAVNKVLYPVFDNEYYSEQHSFIANILKSADKTLLLSVVDRILKEAESLGCETVLLSGEELCLLNPIEVERLYKAFSGNDVQIILYVRNYWRYCLSQYNQHLRSAPERYSLEEIYNRVSSFDYLDALQCWESFFGYKGVHLKVYENVNKAIEKDFIDFMGLESSKFEFFDERFNISPDNLTSFIINEVFEGLSDKVYYNFILKYNSVFKGGRFISHIDWDVVDFFSRRKCLNFNHPKLIDYADVLGSIPSVESNLSTSRSEYVNKLCEFLTDLDLIIKEKS